MEDYMVILRDEDGWEFQFHCSADDVKHAEEQALNAYPHDEIVYSGLYDEWVNQD